jgi:hypothetical protein
VLSSRGELTLNLPRPLIGPVTGHSASKPAAAA